MCTHVQACCGLADDCISARLRGGFTKPAVELTARRRWAPGHETPILRPLLTAPSCTLPRTASLTSHALSATHLVSLQALFCDVQGDPIVVLGDVVISFEFAASQAAERHGLYGADYSTYDELRVLLVHGVLHLLGLDHELGPEASDVMAAEEVRIMQALGWKGAGLIELAGVDSDSEEEGAPSLQAVGAWFALCCATVLLARRPAGKGLVVQLGEPSLRTIGCCLVAAVGCRFLADNAVAFAPTPKAPPHRASCSMQSALRAVARHPPVPRQSAASAYPATSASYALTWMALS